MIKISICIPTFNQPKSLELLLNAIFEQLVDNLEVIICDDSDNNLSSLVVQKYSSLLDIKYLKRDRLGLDRALIDLVNISQGEYIWWIGDDIILPGALNRINEFLLSFKPDFLWLNSYEIEDPENITFKIDNNIITNDPNDLLEFGLGLLGFISSTIFKKSLVNDCIKDAEEHVGTAWVCLYLILKVISSHGKLAIFSEPCFMSYQTKSGVDRWYDKFQVFALNLFDIVDIFKSDLKGKNLKNALDLNLRQILNAILVERAMGYSNGFASNEIRILELIKRYNLHSILWIYIPLLFLPRKILSKLYVFYKLTR